MRSEADSTLLRAFWFLSSPLKVKISEYNSGRFSMFCLHKPEQRGIMPQHSLAGPVTTPFYLRCFSYLTWTGKFYSPK